MTEQDKAKIVTLWENGMSLNQIMNVMPCKCMEFRQTVAEMKANGEFPTKRVTCAEKVAEAVKNGVTNPYELAEMFGISVNTAKRYKRTYGGVAPKKRPKRNYTHCPRTLAIIDDLKEGTLTVAEIARKNGVKWQTVHDVRLRMREDENEGNT